MLILITVYSSCFTVKAAQILLCSLFSNSFTCHKFIHDRADQPQQIEVFDPLFILTSTESLVSSILNGPKVMLYKNIFLHTEIANKMQQSIKILLFHVYMKLNMFRATHRPSSGA